MTDLDERTSASAELRELALEHYWFHSAYPWAAANQPRGFLVLDRGEGAHVIDVEGHRYLDLCAGLWLAQVGYGRREIAEAYAEQAVRLHYARHSSPAEPTLRLAKKLADITPGDLSKVFFTGGGSEANEAALKMAVQYHRLNGEPERTLFIGRTMSYHGATFATMSVGGSDLLRRDYFEHGFLPGATLVPGPGLPGWTERSLDELDSLITEMGPHRIAGFVGEPVSNSAGVHVPDADYWPRLRSICDRHGILLIVDEVVTGFGRTGRMFGIEHWGVVPDIMTIAKGATSGYAPLGAAIARRHIGEAFRPGPAEAFQHVVTYGGHAAACAAALANIAIIEREGLVERAVTGGEDLRGKLRQELATNPHLLEVRGIGQMTAVQLSRDGRTPGGFAPEERARFSQTLIRDLLDEGLIAIGNADRITIIPPLIVTSADIDHAARGVGRAVANLAAAVTEGRGSNR